MKRHGKMVSGISEAMALADAGQKVILVTLHGAYEIKRVELRNGSAIKTYGAGREEELNGK